MTNQTGPIGTSFEKLRQELDTLLESAWTNGEKALDRMGLRSGNSAFDVRADLTETPEVLTVSVDLPGIDPANVNVSLIGNMLTIQGERPATEEHVGTVRHFSEIRHGKFTRSIPLPVAVNADAVSANSHNGVLVIRLEKQHIAKPRQIPIQVTGSDPI